MYAFYMHHRSLGATRTGGLVRIRLRSVKAASASGVHSNLSAFFINRSERALARYEEDGPPPSNFNEVGHRLWCGGRTLQSVMNYITAGDNPLMHLKCIHELCIILLIFQSYLHHIRVISLFYINFGNISQFSYFSGINIF